MVYKLYIRQCKCLLELCRIPQAQEAFDKAIDAIDRSGMKKELRKVKSASGCSFLLNWTKLAEFDLDAIHEVCNWILVVNSGCSIWDLQHSVDFQDFSVIQILREINLWVGFSLQKVQKYHKNQNSQPLNLLKWQILHFKNPQNLFHLKSEW